MVGSELDAVGVIPELSPVEDAYRTHGKRLWWALLAYSGDPEIASDAVAEAFAQALRAEAGIRSPADWVWRVAFRLAAGELKRRGRFTEEPDRMYEFDHRAREVIAALAALSPRQRSAVVLHYYGGYSTREIGSMTGSSGATVAVHLHRARKRLRDLLEERDD